MISISEIKTYFQIEKLFSKNIFLRMGLSGPYLKFLLKEKLGLSLQEVADRLGMSVQNLGHHLRKEEVGKHFLRDLEETFKVDFQNENTLRNNQKPTTKKDTWVNEDKAEYGDPDTDIMVAFAGRVAIYIAKTRELSAMVAEHEVRFDKMFDIIADLRRADERQEKAIEELKKVHHG